MQVVSVVVAGGSGSRLGGTIPKQFVTIAGRSMLSWSILAMQRVSASVVVVVPEDQVGEVHHAGVDVVPGGATRADSVRAGLDRARRQHPSHVLIHDAARPCVPAEVVDRVLGALRAGHRAVVPVVPVTDTLRRVAGGTVDRSTLCAVQTPQGFELEVIERAHASGADGTDDASLVDAIGVEVHHVAGDPANIKVTVAADLAMAEILLG